jgi:hypothetical protein
MRFKEIRRTIRISRDNRGREHRTTPTAGGVRCLRRDRGIKYENAAECLAKDGDALSLSAKQ